MNRKAIKIDIVKLALYLLKRSWIIILCGVIGCAAMYTYTASRQVDTYTASGTMYVYNGNPNVINYQYTNTSDLNSAVMLMDTYMVVIKSNKVMDAVVERLAPDYPGITGGYITGTLSMGSVSETGVLKVNCTTNDAQKSADICNAVMDVAPSEIIRVVSAGDIQVIDYATPPTHPDAKSLRRKALSGGLVGALIPAGILTLLFLLNQTITEAKELTDSYTPPVLASIKRDKRDSKDPSAFVLSEKSSMELTESYAKLRMNLLYTLIDKGKPVVSITSAISGEGKSSIAANLAISVAGSGKSVLLIDADLRRACQGDIFRYKSRHAGLSEVLVGKTDWRDAIVATKYENLEILPAGRQPPNPTELLGSHEMGELLKQLSKEYDLILLDTPPVNIVSDPLALSDQVAGSLFVVRQNFSDHREVRKALTAAELTGLNVLGFVFFGEKVNQSSYYSRKYYKGYYRKYYKNYSTGKS